MMGGRAELRRYDSREGANRAAAERFAEQASRAVEERGLFTVALSGGPEPQEMHAMLAGDDLRDRVPWESVHVFFGDERMVPPHHPRSNYRLAFEHLLGRVRIPRENIHRMAGEMAPADAAEQYRGELEQVFGASAPVFDLVLLGVGTDGHTASLFPFQTNVLHERDRPVREAFDRENAEPRLTLTLSVINAARMVELLVLEGEKAAIVRRVVSGALDPIRMPAQFVRPHSPPLWHLSPEAAKELDGA